MGWIIGIAAGVVGGYQSMEDAVVKGYKKIEDSFVDKFLEKVKPDEQKEKE